MKFAQRIMRQWGSMMVEKREEKKQSRRLTEDQKSSRKKLADVIKTKTPWGLLDKHSDDEIIALLADEDLIKGALFLGKSANDIIKSVVGILSPKQKKDSNLMNIPTID